MQTFLARLLRRFLLASLLLALSVSVSAQAPGQPDPSDPLLRLSAWLDAVERHQPGVSDAAMLVVSGFSGEELQRLWIDVQAFLASLANPRMRNFAVVDANGHRKWVSYSSADLTYLDRLAGRFRQPGTANRLMKRGALLHADIALLGESMFEGTWASSGGVVQRLVLEVEDGEHRGNHLAAPHLELGRTLLGKVTPTPSEDDMVRLWYRATLASLHGSERYDVPHAVRALELFPDDAFMALQAGCLHEALASVTVQSGLRSVRLPLGATLMVGSARAEVKQAQRFFERALQADSDLAEARIRLGRVLGLQGEHRAAVRELQRGLQLTSDTVLQYYAQLFLGLSEEALGRIAPARTAYEQARMLFPRAQSPRLALGRMAQVMGDDAVALQHVESVLQIPIEAERHDPWWTYHIGAGRSAEALWARLRAPFLSSERE